MTNKDGTFTCAHEACDCRVADDSTHPKDELGRLYCCEECRDGDGCRHGACGCAGNG